MWRWTRVSSSIYIFTICTAQGQNNPSSLAKPENRFESEEYGSLKETKGQKKKKAKQDLLCFLCCDETDFSHQVKKKQMQINHKILSSSANTFVEKETLAQTLVRRNSLT